LDLGAARFPRHSAPTQPQAQGGSVFAHSQPGPHWHDGVVVDAAAGWHPQVQAAPEQSGQLQAGAIWFGMVGSI